MKKKIILKSMATLTLKNVSFKIEPNLSENISQEKRLSIQEPEKEKRRNSKVTLNSLDVSTKNSINKYRRSRPSIFFSDIKLRNNYSNCRLDAYGNKISKDSKNYQVTFIDQVSPEKIAEVVLIESSYSLEKKEKEKKDESFCLCSSCFVF